MIKQYICETLRETPSPDASFDHVILSYCVTASGTRHQTKPSNHAFRYFDDVPTHVRDYQLDLNHTSAQPPDQRCLLEGPGKISVSVRNGG